MIHFGISSKDVAIITNKSCISHRSSQNRSDNLSGIRKYILTTSNLTLRNWLDPRNSNDDSKNDNANNPKHLPIGHALVLGDDAEDDATERTEDDVEETGHSCPSTGAGLTELGEVLEVVCAEDSVDGEFSTEGTEAEHYDLCCLWTEDDRHGFLEGWLHDNFSMSGIEHLLFSYLCLVV
jgi:hypothetical protein